MSSADFCSVCHGNLTGGAAGCRCEVSPSPAEVEIAALRQYVKELREMIQILVEGIDDEGNFVYHFDVIEDARRAVAKEWKP